MVFVMLPPQWLKDKDSSAVPLQLECSFEEALEYNRQGYNIYHYPNHPSEYGPTGFVKASEVDVFNWVFLDLDRKHGEYESSEAFVNLLKDSRTPPTFIVETGNGTHAYWSVDDLDAMSFLRLARRLCAMYKSDPAVCQLKQLMRYPGTLNNKEENNPRPCEIVLTSEAFYTCEDLDKDLPRLTEEDENYCQAHYNKAYKITDNDICIDDKLPSKFGDLLAGSKEAKEIWIGNTDDRSSGDYRLGHLMFASGFTKAEAASVLVNSAKALSRAPVHRASYATNIIDKIWTFEITKDFTLLSRSVREILMRGEETLAGTRFACHPLLDNTAGGFRLGHVIGLVAGAGVGKTSMAINMFKWFTERNPDYDHFFVSLEQSENEIAVRWRTACQGNDGLHDKVHVLGNHNPDGSFRHLSLSDIKDYILAFKKATGKKVGTVVIDHIGILRKESKNGENQALVDICHKMKSFAVETNTLVVMQSQAPREKAGRGDLEIGKDAAYGTVFFESYVDYLITIWQPLKRCYVEGAPTTMAFKFCKIRHKKQHIDRIKEDVPYRLYFDPETETLREMTQIEEKSFDFFNQAAVNKRKADRATDLVEYTSARVDKGETNGQIQDNQDDSRDKIA